MNLTNELSCFYKKNVAQLKLKNRINSYSQFKEEMNFVYYAAGFLSQQFELDTESFFNEHLNTLNFMVLKDDLREQRVVKLGTYFVVIPVLDGELQTPEDYYTEATEYIAKSADDFAQQVANNSKLSLIKHNNKWKERMDEDTVSLSIEEIDSISRVVEKSVLQGEIRGSHAKYFYSQTKEIGLRINTGII